MKLPAPSYTVVFRGKKRRSRKMSRKQKRGKKESWEVQKELANEMKGNEERENDGEVRWL